MNLYKNYNKGKKRGNTLVPGYFPVLFPLAVAVLQARADALDVPAGLADGELLALFLEEDYLDPVAAAFLTLALSGRREAVGYLG